MLCFYDQVCVSNLVAVELLMRKVQLIEFQYEEARRVEEVCDKKKGGGKGKSQGMFSDESLIFAGKHLEMGNVMVCPVLLEHVAKEADREVVVMTAVRKAREERALARKDKV